MALFDKLSKGVSKAAEQAKFEADKLMRVNKLNSEVGDLTRQLSQTTASIGAKVMELQAAGKIQVPELEGLISQVKLLEAQLAAKKADWDAAKALKFEAVAAAAAAAPADKCPSCGAAVQPGTKFCPSCGQKLG